MPRLKEPMDLLEWLSTPAKYIYSKQNAAMKLNITEDLGQVQTPYFTWAESNASKEEQRIFLISIRFGSCVLGLKFLYHDNNGNGKVTKQKVHK